MKKNIIALTVLMALSATAQADSFPKKTHDLSINGSVIVDGCAFEDGNDEGQALVLNLKEVSLATVLQHPTTMLDKLTASASNTLSCPSGITGVNLTLEPLVDTFVGEVMKNTALTDAATGVGFKVAAAFGTELNDAPTWVDFSNVNKYPVTLTDGGKIAVNFGANYALTGTMADATAGTVEAKLPFTISYN